MTRKKHSNKLFKLELKLNIRKDKKFKVEAIKNTAIYTKPTDDQLVELNYQISLKNYPENESILKLASAIMYFCKIINTFHKYYLETFITMFL